MAMMFSQKLVLYCIVCAGAYLLLISAALGYVQKKLGLTRGIPPEMMEDSGLGWSAIHFLMEMLFFVAIPTFAYSFFYLIIPLWGIKAGMAATLYAFTLGAAPALMGLSVRIRLPMPYILFSLLALLLKLGGSLTIIGYLFSL
jgi:hypothetical protein